MLKIFQRLLYPLLTIALTVSAFILYSMVIVNGMSFHEMMQGSLMLGHFVGIPVVFLVEFVLAFILEMTVGYPFSCRIVKLAHAEGPMMQYAVSVAATVMVMCPSMSFLAAILYFPPEIPMQVGNLITAWLRLVCVNLPFVFFLQLLFIQPLLKFCFARAGAFKTRVAFD